MDCGAWVNDGNAKVPYVIRVRGCEFGLQGADLSELISHLVAVRDGAKESLSEDYLDLRKMRSNEAKGVSLMKIMGLTKVKGPIGLARRI